MNDIKASIILKVEITNTEVYSKIGTVCTELALTLDEFMLYSINKLLYDIEFVHNIRNIQNINKWAICHLYVKTLLLKYLKPFVFL